MQSPSCTITIATTTLCVVFLLLTTVTLSIAASEEGETVYITPSQDNTSCPPDVQHTPCLTLTVYAQLVQQNAITLNNTTSLVLLQGDHTLEVELTIVNTTSFTLTSIFNNTLQGTLTPPTIRCNTLGRISFQNVSQVVISGINWEGCTDNGFSDISVLTITDIEMSCRGNCASSNALYLVDVSEARIESCLFDSYYTTSANTVVGPVAVQCSQAYILASTFTNNEGRLGGAMYVTDGSNVTIDNSSFMNNTASRGGAMFISQSCSVVIRNGSRFVQNRASLYGGALHMDYAAISIYDSHFERNSGLLGGTTYAVVTTVRVERSVLRNNSATIVGGGLYAIIQSEMKVYSTIFDGNHATEVAASLGAENTDVTLNNCSFMNNVAPVGFIGVITSTLIVSDNCTFMHNLGSFIVLSSNATFTRNVTFFNNTNEASLVTSVVQSPLIFNDLGGAVTFLRSDVILLDEVHLTHNSAKNAGGILTIGSRIMIQGRVEISHNTAHINGGGIVCYFSDILSTGDVTIEHNLAGFTGGAAHIISTTIEVLSGRFIFYNNSAHISGGGLYVRQNSRLHVVKRAYEFLDLGPESFINVTFAGNRAQYGGAINVADNTSSAVCANLSPIPTATNDCFLQTYQAHLQQATRLFNIRNFYFTDNTATISGHDLYGGFLDRCTLSALSELIFNRLTSAIEDLNALDYVQTISDIEDISRISSEPMRVCFCKESPSNNGDLIPDCSYTPPTVYVKKGRTLMVSVVAVDQVDTTLTTSVHASLSSLKAGLDEGQTVQGVTDMCTQLEFNIAAPDDSVSLILHPDGPCDKLGKSQVELAVEFLPCDCGIGLKSSPSPTICECVCDSKLAPYVTECSEEDNTLTRDSNFWIGFVNVSSEMCIAIVPQCPFDYCQSPSGVGSKVNLNYEGGSDTQCAFNRTGKLCGRCQDGLSLALGNSNCIKCNNYWLILLVLFALLGIFIVIFMMICNLTVAVGTINGLIFYANIFTANRSILLPQTFSEIPGSIFYISWINLDWGFETCFYDGMDSYAKTWLQLVFPLYIFGIVFAVLLMSKFSQKFASLLNERNPIATLATLILLSYTKVIRVTVTVLSYTTLSCLNGTATETVWLPDANIKYLQGRHIPLFIVTMIIVVLCLAFTFLLLFGQCLPYFGRWKFLKWTRDTKFTSFMDAYHAPYNPKHRYWVGLLLLVRIFLYLVSSTNTTGNPYTTLYSVGISIIFLLMIKQLSNRIYKNWIVDALETSFLINLIVYAGATLYIRDLGGGNQTALAFTSFGVAIATVLIIFAYHTYYYIIIKTSAGQEIVTTIKEKLKFQRRKKPPKHAVQIRVYDRERSTTLRESCLDLGEGGALHDESVGNMRDEVRRSGCTFTEIDFIHTNDEQPLSALVMIQEEEEEEREKEVEGECGLIRTDYEDSTSL